MTHSLTKLDPHQLLINPRKRKAIKTNGIHYKIYSNYCWSKFLQQKLTWSWLVTNVKLLLDSRLGLFRLCWKSLSWVKFAKFQVGRKCFLSNNIETLCEKIVSINLSVHQEVNLSRIEIAYFPCKIESVNLNFQLVSFLHIFIFMRNPETNKEAQLEAYSNLHSLL